MKSLQNDKAIIYTYWHNVYISKTLLCQQYNVNY